MWSCIKTRKTHQSATNQIKCASLVHLSELFHLYVPSRSLRSSSDTKTFRIPHFKRKQHGGRAFAKVASQIWNNLPFLVRHSQSLESFRASQKTFLFRQYFDDQFSCVSVCVCACVCVCVVVCAWVFFLILLCNLLIVKRFEFHKVLQKYSFNQKQWFNYYWAPQFAYLFY